MGNKFMRFMSGRYGMYAKGLDTLNKYLLYTVIALWIFNIIIAFFTRILVFNIIFNTIRILGLLILAWAIFRFLSRNISKRQHENMTFIRLLDNIKATFNKKAADPNRIYSCPSCHTRVRVPRGKGKIKITCPKCKTAFIRKT